MTEHAQRQRRRFCFVWRIPILLAVLSVFGLVAALLDTGAWHCASAMPLSLCPSIGWNGTTLVALPHLAAPFRVKDLDPVQGNLRPQASGFVAALDAVVSGI